MLRSPGSINLRSFIVCDNDEGVEVTSEVTDISSKTRVVDDFGETCKWFPLRRNQE